MKLSSKKISLFLLISVLFICALLLLKFLYQGERKSLSNLQGALILDKPKEIKNFGLSIAQNSTVNSKVLFDGKIGLIYFGFTSCPDICPLSLGYMASALSQLEIKQPEIANKIAMVFISVDTDRDQPKQSRDYAQFFHPDLKGGNWLNDGSSLENFAKQFGAYFEIENRPSDDETYSVGHTGHIVIVRQSPNQPLEYIGIFGSDHNEKQIVHDLPILVENFAT